MKKFWTLRGIYKADESEMWQRSYDTKKAMEADYVKLRAMWDEQQVEIEKGSVE